MYTFNDIAFSIRVRFRSRWTSPKPGSWSFSFHPKNLQLVWKNVFRNYDNDDIDDDTEPL